MNSERTILVTGIAGFIGMHVGIALLRAGHRVVGVDNLNDYYSVKLKRDRLAEIGQQPQAAQFTFVDAGVEDEEAMRDVIRLHPVQSIVHLAAQAGVRHSIENPMAYARSNLVGMTVMLEVARTCEAEHMVYASSSSVYGGNTKVPYAETDRVDSPVSFYAATKRANEVMAASYSHLYDLPLTGLRFFTVYGPWGRPDMAPWLFTDAIIGGRPIKLFGHGKPQRDFTYIDDIVSGICRTLEVPASGSGSDLHRVLNIGNHKPVSVLEFVSTLEAIIGVSAIREPVPMQPGDVQTTYADITALNELVSFTPTTPLHDGLEHFVRWFRQYHQIAS